MMKGWCELNEGRPVEGKQVKKQVCGQFAMRTANVARRDALIAFWCENRKHDGSPKCLQLRFMRKLVAITNPQARAKAVEQFKSSRGEGAQQAASEESAVMMRAVCADPTLAAKFAATCAQLKGEAPAAARAGGLGTAARG